MKSWCSQLLDLYHDSIRIMVFVLFVLLCSSPVTPSPHPPQPVQAEKSGNTIFGPQLQQNSVSVSLSCISLLQQSPLPCKPKPSDHSHLALTQSLTIYTSQREERVNVGNTVFFVEAENRPGLVDVLLCAMPSVTTRVHVISTEVNDVTGVCREADQWAKELPGKAVTYILV